jgi:hypothetical protein
MIDKIKEWFSRKQENARLKLQLEEAREKLSILETEKKDFQASQLRVYLKQGCEETLENCEQLLSSDEALKAFGQMWGKYKLDTMMMMTAIEYEYIHKYDFNQEELQVLRHVIGNIGLFYRGCKVAHDTKEELRRLQK